MHCSRVTFFYFPSYQLDAEYLQMYTRNKPYFCGLYCCSCFVLTICATRDVILPVKYVLYVVIIIIIIIIIIVMLLFCCCCSSSILF